MKAQTARQLRRLHHYVGLFFAPAILFFAFSGALQTIGLHENHGPGPQPPAWIRWMASVHKDQRPLKIVPAEPAQPGPAAQKDKHADDHEDEGPSPVPMKAFVLLLSIGLITSSLLGVTIALTNRATRRSSVLALALGTVTPLILLYL
ncbi:hypothetical protein [Sphingomonas oryzagri]